LTLSELISYRYIISELDRLNKQLNALEQDRCGRSSGGEHVSCGVGDSTASTAAKIVDLQSRIDKLLERKKVVESYIQGIERADIKYILTARFIDGMTYPDISRELKKHKLHITARAARERARRYIEKE
jgi:hypothetical protein